MSELFNIIRKHRESFYDFATGKRLSLWKTDLAEFAFSATLALVFSKISIELLSAALTTYSILIGFSFNVLFYLLSFNDRSSKTPNQSLERTLKVERLGTLSDELFYNVSYFNVVSIALVMLILVWFLSYLPEPAVSHALEQLFPFHQANKYSISASSYMLTFARFLCRMLFYGLMIETMHCFVRTVGRVSYYFDQKKGLQKDGM